MRVITVEIICPSTSRSYDYRIPPLMKSEDIKKRIIEDIRIYEGIDSLFEDEDGTRLFLENMTAVSPNMTMDAAGVRNGDRIMLI